MKCSKCKKRNVSQANYCIKCGNRFSSEEKKSASKKNLFKIIVDIKKWYSNTPIKKITDSIYYKIGTITVTIIIGILFMISNGNYLKLMESDNYTYIYDKNIEAYHLYLNDVESNINLYLPHKTNKFYVRVYDQTNNLLKEDIYDDINDIKIILNGNNYYEVSYSKNKTNKNTIRIYPERAN